MEPFTSFDFPQLDLQGFDARPPTAEAQPDHLAADPDPAEVEQFARALNAYKRRSGRMFPTWSEILEVLRSLGYARAGDDLSSGGVSTSPSYRVAILREGPLAVAIARTLEDQGGTAVPSRTQQIFEFDSIPSRDHAMDAVQAAFGWTSVERRR